MSWFNRKPKVEERSVDFSNFSRDVAAAMVNGSQTNSGENITERTSLQVSAVFACVRAIAEPIATLPIDTYLPSPDGSSRLPYKRPVWLDTPNVLRPELTRIALVQQALWSLLLWGDAFIAVYRDERGAIIGLDLLDPDSVFVDRDRSIVNGRPSNRRIYWVGAQVDGLPLPGAAPLSSSDVIHIPGYMVPGATRGLSVIKQAAAETIGLAKAAQTFGATFFGNGAHPGLVVEVAGPLSADGQAALKRAWNDTRKGASNAHGIAVATEGAKFTKVSLAPEEAQFIETRQFSVPDIARFFGVPPHKIADASNSTSWGSGLAEQNAGFVTETLGSWVSRIDEGFTRLFLSDLSVNRAAYMRMNMSAFLRGSLGERMKVYDEGLSIGFYCLDEVRALEDMPPLPDGLGKVHRGKNLLIPLAVGDAYPTPPRDANLPKGNPEVPATDPATEATP